MWWLGETGATYQCVLNINSQVNAIAFTVFNMCFEGHTEICKWLKQYQYTVIYSEDSIHKFKTV